MVILILLEFKLSASHLSPALNPRAQRANKGTQPADRDLRADLRFSSPRLGALCSQSMDGPRQWFLLLVHLAGEGVSENLNVSPFKKVLLFHLQNGSYP